MGQQLKARSYPVTQVRNLVSGRQIDDRNTFGDASGKRKRRYAGGEVGLVGRVLGSCRQGTASGLPSLRRIRGYSRGAQLSPIIILK
jgi:hypothetical protein